MKKRTLLYIGALCAMLLFVLAPLPSSGLYLRLYFGELEGTDVSLYYSTDESPQITAEQIIHATWDETGRIASLYLDSDLVSHIDCMRLDFPPTPQLLDIRDISVSSAGLVRHRFNPCSFFQGKNILATNDIETISIAPAIAGVFMRTDGQDPYIVFSNSLLNQVLKYKSRYRLTRVVICLLGLACAFLYRKNLFGAKPETEV